jgi:hypothetical protein
MRALQRIASRKCKKETQSTRQSVSRHIYKLLRAVALRLLKPSSRRSGMSFFPHVPVRRFFALLIPLLLQGHLPALAQKGFYRVSNWEQGTKVFLNEEELLDLAGQHAPGEYTLRVEKSGYHAYVDRVTIYSDQLVEIRIRNMAMDVRPRPFRQRRDARMLPMTGTLIVTSNPPGQQVYLDTLLRGETPLVLENVPVGRRAVRIGEATTTFSLQIFESVRLRLQDGNIQNVTDEDLPEDQRGVQIEDLALFMVATDSEATVCTNFHTGAGSQVFKLDKDSKFLVGRMSFVLAGESQINFPARFRLYRGSQLIHESEHAMIIDRNENRRLCYYHHEFWERGEYVLTIDSAAGKRLGPRTFTIYF